MFPLMDGQSFVPLEIKYIEMERERARESERARVRERNNRTDWSKEGTSTFRSFHKKTSCERNFHKIELCLYWMRVKLLNIYTGMNWIFLFCFYFTLVLDCLKSKQIEHLCSHYK